MKYTVLLLRPDYIASDYGQDTYLAWVEADDVAEAQVLAQLEAAEADREKEPSDYYTLFVAAGHLNDLKES